MNKKSCKCGHWYNESTKCPDCDTVASDKYNDIGKIRREKIQEMIDGRYRNVKKTDVLYKIAIGLQKRTPYETVYAIEKYVYNRWDYMSDKKQFGKRTFIFSQ